MSLEYDDVEKLAIEQNFTGGVPHSDWLMPCIFLAGTLPHLARVLYAHKRHTDETN